jgi:hypothetical protein
MNSKETGIRQRLTNMGRNWSTAKPTKTTTFWIAIGAIGVALYLGFAQAGWVTDNTAQQRAALTAQGAVVDRLAPICVAQFNEDPDKEGKLVELKVLSTSNQRTNFVKDQGWATMLGESAPDTRVANACAIQLMLISE